MGRLREWMHRLWGLSGRARTDGDLHEELRVHLELAGEDLKRQRESPENAARTAALRAGGITQAMDQLRDQRGLPWVEDLGRDLRHGMRTLVRQSGFLTAVVLTLGLGVGGSAAIFGAVNGILLTPLPYPEAERIAVVWHHDRRSGNARQEASPANFLDWRDRAGTFERLAAMEPFGFDWSHSDGTIYLPTWLVYEGFFDVFRTRPLLGRTFRLDEHERGHGDVVILGYNLWRSRFGGADDVLGRTLILDNRPYTVVGVMPEGFSMPNDDAMWAPKVLQGWEANNRTSVFYSVFGRLRDGVTMAQAAADLDTVAAALSREYPETNASSGVVLVPLPDQILGSVRTALWLLFGAVVLVLAVVTASVASMQFAQASARTQEFAVRASLGAGWARVARQLVAEALILAVLATVVGFAVARAALIGIRALAPATLPRVSELRADADVFVFASCLGVALALASGLVPLFIAGRARLVTGLGPGMRVAHGGRLLARTQSALVVFQCAATLILLVGAGLLIRSVVAVLNEPAGFRSDGVVAVTVQSWRYYPDGPARATFVRTVVDRLSSEPGITAAGMTSSVPLMETIGAETAPLTIEGAPPRPLGESAPLVHFTIVAGDLFDAYSIPLVRGRLFEGRDGVSSTPVAIVNEAFARQYFPDSDPIGRRVRLESAREVNAPQGHEIVGVVGDVRRFGLHEAPRPGIYLAHAQAGTGANAFIVRGDRPPAELVRLTRNTIWQINAALPIYDETTMAELVGASIRERRFMQVLLSTFAALALALAAAGVFGLMSFVTARRAREFGVRLALGAPRGALFGSVLMRGMALTVIGMALGLLGALATTRALTALLYHVTPLDPLTFAAAMTVLAGTAAVASLYPATRAARLNPTDILQGE